VSPLRADTRLWPGVPTAETRPFRAAAE
jgi:hypothetical protein